MGAGEESGEGEGEGGVDLMGWAVGCFGWEGWEGCWMDWRLSVLGRLVGIGFMGGACRFAMRS